MIDFKDIKNKIRASRFDTLRLDEENIFEIVAAKEDVATLVQQLEGFFGAPVFPSKDKLPLEINRVIDGFGGIMPGQTLYYSNDGSNAIFAMLWPWSDGVHTTIKVIKK